MTMEELLKDLSKSVSDLKEAVSTKFSTATPVQTEAEKDVLVKNVQDLQHQINDIKKAKAVRKMVFSIDGKAGEGEESVSFSKFLKAVLNHDHSILKTANGMSLTSADGGYAVPIEYMNRIIELERAASIARNICSIVPMGTGTRYIPSQLTNPTVYWVNEATLPTAKSKVTLSRVTQTAKKVLAIAPVTAELLQDNNVSIDQFLFAKIAEAIAVQEDKMAFVGGVTENSDPFDGVYYADDVDTTTMAGANLAFSDLIDLQFGVKAPYRARGRYVLSSDALAKVMKLKDDNLQPIWTMPREGAPGLILGKPYSETDQIPSTLGTGAQTAILFGAFDHVWISDLGGYEVDASNSASDANAAAGSAFLLDEIWYRFKRRMSINVVQPEAFSKMVV